ncbi:MAG: hypothetical protein R6V05_07480 [Candidatus Brocadiia bacterium]
MRTLTIDPLIPGTLWALLAVVSVAAIALYLLVRPPRVSRARRVVIGLLLVLGVGGLLAVLLNPTWQQVKQALPRRPPLAVLVDTSGSMDTADQRGKTRLDAARRLAGRLAEELDEPFEVSLWSFDTELKAPTAQELASARADGMATDLGGCVQRALSSAVGEEGAMVVLSDGISNVGDPSSGVAEAARTARAMATPIFTRTIGSSATVEDLEVVVTTPSELGFVGQRVPLAALVHHAGVEGIARVALRHEGEVLESTTVALPTIGPAYVSFQVDCEAPGLSRYVLEAEARPGEIVRGNNTGVAYVRVTDEPICVLVLEGKPYWDFKFLMRRLARDESLRVRGAVRIRRGRVFVREIVPAAGDAEEELDFEEHVEQVAGGEALLGSYEQLQDCHVLVFGRDAEAFLTPAAIENVARWVSEDGGAMVCARGCPVQKITERLDALMPVRWEESPEARFRIHMTRDARRAGWLPVRAPLMPSLGTQAAVEEVKPLATVLARADPGGPLAGMPVITMQGYGSGRVLVIEGSGLWRWALAETDGADEPGTTYGEFWGSLVRWLAGSADFPPGSTAALRPLRRVFTTLEQPSLQLLVREGSPLAGGTAPEVEIVSGQDGRVAGRARALPSGSSRGLLEVSTEALPAGWYRARVVQPPVEEEVECAFDVTEPRQEKVELRARPAVMAQLAEDSGGKVLTEDAAGQVQAAYFEQWQARHPEEFERTPVWDRLPWLLAVAAALGGAWIVRRRGGLV